MTTTRRPKLLLRWVSLGLVWILGPTACRPAGATDEARAMALAVESADPAPTEAVYAALVAEARRFLTTLPPAMRARAVLSADNPYRTRGFCYTLAKCKSDYRGLRIAELTAEQRALYHGVLVHALSSQGYEKVKSIINRERLLQEMEDAHRADPARYVAVGGQNAPGWKPPAVRDSEVYTLAFFGEPGDDRGWALRFEGHHISVNLSFKRVNGRLSVAAAPSFFGASPMVVPAAPTGSHFPRWRAEEGQQVLRKEMVLARTFVHALDAGLRKRAAWPELPVAELEGGTDLPLDVKAHERKDAGPGATFKDLSPQARALLWDFVREFVRNQEPRFVDSRALAESLVSAKVHFYGNVGDEYGPFYLRVESRRFLIELLQAEHFGVKTEIDANHVHAAFRDLANDFDSDVLQDHLARFHQPGSPPHDHVSAPLAREP